MQLKDIQSDNSRGRFKEHNAIPLTSPTQRPPVDQSHVDDLMQQIKDLELTVLRLEQEAETPHKKARLDDALGQDSSSSMQHDSSFAIVKRQMEVASHLQATRTGPSTGDRTMVENYLLSRVDRPIKTSLHPARRTDDDSAMEKNTSTLAIPDADSSVGTLFASATFENYPFPEDEDADDGNFSSDASDFLENDVECPVHDCECICNDREGTDLDYSSERLTELYEVAKKMESLEGFFPSTKPFIRDFVQTINAFQCLPWTVAYGKDDVRLQDFLYADDSGVWFCLTGILYGERLRCVRQNGRMSTLRCPRHDTCVMVRVSNIRDERQLEFRSWFANSEGIPSANHLLV